MLKKILLTLIVIAITGLIVLPFVVPATIHSAISVSTSLVGALASLVTLIIAILLYNKFGIDKPVLDKQTEIVLDLLKEIKTTRFIFEGGGIWLQLRVSDMKNDYWQAYKDKELLFGLDYMEGLSPLAKLRDNVLLPKEIANTMDITTTPSIASSPYDEDRNFKESVPSAPKRDEEHYGKMNNEAITMTEFVCQWRSIVETTEKWLNKNAAKSMQLNFWREMKE